MVETLAGGGDAATLGRGRRAGTGQRRARKATAADPARAVEKRVRAHLARELHDRVAQSLTVMLMEMENFKHTQQGRESVIQEVVALQDSTREVLLNVRELLYDLRGESGIDKDFLGVLRSGLLHRFSEGTGIPVTLTHTAWPTRLPRQATVNLYRILQEALNNVRLHSGATAVAVAFAQGPDGGLAMTVSDDGRGFEEVDAFRAGMGMLGIRERAMLLGGMAKVTSATGGGTSVQVLFPRQSLK